MNDESKQKIGQYMKDAGIDKDELGQLWKQCADIEDESLKLIAMGILSDEKVKKVFEKFSLHDLTKYGITNFREFWLESVKNKIDIIKTEEDATNVVNLALQKKLRTKSKQFAGIVIAEGRKRDNFDKFISLVLDIYKSDPQVAEDTGYVKIFNNIDELRNEFPEIEKKLTDKYFVDDKIVIPIGKKDINLSFGEKTFKRKNWYNGRYENKPIIGTAYMKSLTIIAKTDDEQYKVYDMVLNDEQCELPTHSGKYVEFYANVSPSDKRKLNTASHTNFKPIENVVFKIEEAENALKDILLPFDNVLEYVNNRKESEKYKVKATWARVSDMAATERSSYMNLIADKEDSVDDMLNLFDDKGEFKDTSMYCIIPDHVHVEFGEGSKILVFGTPRYGSSYENGSYIEDKTKASMWVSGIFVPEEEKVAPVESVNVSEQEINETFEEDATKEVDISDLDSL